MDDEFASTNEPQAAAHFTLWFYAGIARAIDAMATFHASLDELFEGFPFLADYWDQIGAAGIAVKPGEAFEAVLEKIRSWESEVGNHLPIRALEERLAVPPGVLAVAFVAGLPDEDARFGQMFARLHGDAWPRRLTLGLATGWWHSGQERMPRRAFQRLLDGGVLASTPSDGPRSEWALHCPIPLWAVVRGERVSGLPGLGPYGSPSTLSPLEAIIARSATIETAAELPELLRAGRLDAIVVRGPPRNGRRTLLGAIARACGRGVFEVEARTFGDADRRRELGAIASALHAFPLLTFSASADRRVEIPASVGLPTPVLIALPSHAAIAGGGLERPFFLDLEIPDRALRRRHWMAASTQPPPRDVDELARRFRMTSGNIHRIAEVAAAEATIDGKEAVDVEHVGRALRQINRRALGSLAVRLPPLDVDETEPSRPWRQLIADDELSKELVALEARCRRREDLQGAVSDLVAPTVTPGVRALFAGPSGTGKTLAARILAGRLGLDLYRLNLATVVDKYIGETEKNLEQVFSEAETLDVVLLIDEGDSLLGRRTQVSSANDRYANLETNHLLQRLEAFEGIVVITTNAPQLLDNAFERRLDHRLDFRRPERAERLALWNVHLPSDHRVDDAVLNEIARRCAFTGGQVRNAVIHAALLSLERGHPITSDLLRASVVREYRRLGEVSPIAPPGS